MAGKLKLLKVTATIYVKDWILYFFIEKLNLFGPKSWLMEYKLLLLDNNLFKWASCKVC